MHIYKHNFLENSFLRKDDSDNELSQLWQNSITFNWSCGESNCPLIVAIIAMLYRANQKIFCLVGIYLPYFLIYLISLEYTPNVCANNFGSYLLCHHFSNKIPLCHHFFIMPPLCYHFVSLVSLFTLFGCKTYLA